MKKTIIALAALGTFAGFASAQSNLTLSGQVDLGVIRADKQWTMGGAGSARNNITFSGKEDLGNGMAAGFYIQHRFDLSNGTVNSSPTRSAIYDPVSGALMTPASSQFWRQGWIQLDSGFGDLRLGRMLSPLQQLNGDFDPFETYTVASVHTGGRSSGNLGDSRYSNSIYYRTPSFGGFKAHAMIAAAEDQGSAKSPEKPAGIAAEYKGGPIYGALAWDRNQDDVTMWGLYGMYNFGVAAAMFQYESGETSATDNTKIKRWSIGAKAPLGAAVLKAGYTKWKEEDIKKFGIGADYNLSKRTFLYADVGKLSGDGVTELQKKTRFDIGVSHKF